MLRTIKIAEFKCFCRILNQRHLVILVRGRYKTVTRVMMMIMIILYYYLYLKLPCFQPCITKGWILTKYILLLKGIMFWGNSPRRLCLHAFLERLYRKGNKATSSSVSQGRKEGSLPNRRYSSRVRPLIYWIIKMRVPSGLHTKPMVGFRRMNPIFSSGFSNRHKTSSFKSSKTSQPHESHRISRAAFDPESQTGVLPKTRMWSI